MSGTQHPLYPLIKLCTVTATKLYYGLLLTYLKLAPPKLTLPINSSSTTTKAKDYHEYGFATLSAYDLALDWNCFLYGVSKKEMQEWFDQGLTEEHADIGPGSGYYPVHSKRLPALIASSTPSKPIAYHAFDTQETSLLYLTSRLSSRFPLTTSSSLPSTASGNGTPSNPSLALQTHLFDARQHARARSEFGGKMQSVNMHFLLHCIPPTEGGGPEDKFEAVLKTAWEMLKPGGSVYGTTILDPLAPSAPGRLNSSFPPTSLRLQPALALISWLQSVGVLCNQGDSLNALLCAAQPVGFEFEERGGRDVYLRGVVCFFRFRKPEERKDEA
ncbi:hypothetical protein BCV69DRAFT_284870 [Microstroma glucosiphilum]|uniref:Methyltransferase type 11 domain-containing protein n=1 Tax=Pseudomicrostroma glucosiphilum TaxID=1684307 RepID=A0A316U6H8_9BASI|nr:hypothetical protein BCV69DRAFT_284870 [Pseudomicrostroma glucosiphilum]PWN18565.1 hypothetical protein BCV69DRAFT_284870 [Pseudomicrostroma glucosiphilum]